MTAIWLEGFPSVLILVILPTLILAQRLGWLSRRSCRWAFSFFALTLVLLSLPWQSGLGLDGIKYFNAFFCLITAALLAVRYGWGSMAMPRTGWVCILAGIACMSALNYVNYFSFHGARTFIQLHDVAHYYLGAKYFPELQYDKLYTAMLRAEAELRPGIPSHDQVRDLATNQLMTPGELLAKSDLAKAGFTPKRWALFLADVEYFLDRIEPASYAGILQDHGYNATPFWTLIGGGLANRLPVATDLGLRLLTSIDPILLLILFAVMWRVFGSEIALLSLIFYSVAFGATFGWTGGAFLRQGWFFCVGLGLCALARRRMAVAGAFLAVASLLRIFPLAFAVGPFLWAAWDIKHSGRIESGRWRFVVALLVFGLFGLGATSVSGGGVESWVSFKRNTELHMKNISPNLVGATQLLAYRSGGPREVSAEAFQGLIERRQQIRKVQLMTLLPLTLLFIALASGRWSERSAGGVQNPGRSFKGEALELRASVMGILLLFVGLDLAAYYYVFLMFLIPAVASRKQDWALLFAAEGLLYVLVLATDDATKPYLYRCLLLSWLLIIVYVLPFWADRKSEQAATS